MNNFAEFVKAFCDFGLEMVELSVTTRWHLNQVKIKFSILKAWSYIYSDEGKIFRCFRQRHCDNAPRLSALAVFWIGKFIQSCSGYIQ